jgi:hypothetical protein
MSHRLFLQGFVYGEELTWLSGIGMARGHCVLTPQSGCSHDAAEPECPRRSEVE